MLLYPFALGYCYINQNLHFIYLVLISMLSLDSCAVLEAIKVKMVDLNYFRGKFVK